MNPIEIAMICCIAAVGAVSIYVSGFFIGRISGLKCGLDALSGIRSDIEELRQKLRECEE